MFVDFFVEQAFATSFILLAVTLVLRNGGFQAMVKTGFASILGIEAAIGIEVKTDILKGRKSTLPV